jgi:hypothetical protein
VRRVAIAVAVAWIGCSGAGEPAAPAPEEEARQDEAALERALAEQDAAGIQRYLALRPDGPGAARARAALDALAPGAIERYRAGATVLGAPPGVTLAMVEVLESVAATGRRVPLYWLDETTAPSGDTPADRHFRDAVPLGRERMGLAAAGHEHDTLRSRTRGLFDYADATPGPMPPGDGPGVAIRSVLRPAVEPSSAGLVPPEIEHEIAIRVPAHDGHPGRVVRHAETVRIPAGFQFEWYEVDGRPEEADARRASSFYAQAFASLGTQLHVQSSCVLATVARPEEYADTLPIARDLRAWDAVVRTADGLPGIEAGDRCRVQIGRGHGALPCRIAVSCEGVVVYGAGATGFVPCPSEPGVLAADETTTSGDEDPAITARADTRTLSVRDDASGPLGAFALVADLASARSVP